MIDAYLQILQSARTTMIWETVLIFLFFLTAAVLVFLIPYEYKTKQGLTRGTFLRMTAKWQLWVFKGCFAALLTGVCLWLTLAQTDRIRAVDADISQSTVSVCETEYAVEKPLFSVGKRRTVWITEDGTEVPLVQYGSPLSSGDAGICTVVYGAHSRIVLSMDGTAGGPEITGFSVFRNR